MFKKPFDDESSKLDEAIDTLYDELKGFTTDDEEYAKIVTQLAQLHKMKTQEVELNHAHQKITLESDKMEYEQKVQEENRNRVSLDTLMIVGGNLAGIVAILGFERFHVVTSKALSFVMKTRL